MQRFTEMRFKACAAVSAVINSFGAQLHRMSVFGQCDYMAVHGENAFHLVESAACTNICACPGWCCSSSKQ